MQRVLCRSLTLSLMLGFSIVGCGETAPTELTQDQKDTQAAEDQASIAAEDAAEAQSSKSGN